MNAVDGRMLGDTSVRVSLAKSPSGGPRPAMRQSEEGDAGSRARSRGDSPYTNARGESSGKTEGRAMASNDWRRK